MLEKGVVLVERRGVNVVVEGWVSGGEVGGRLGDVVNKGWWALFGWHNVLDVCLLGVCLLLLDCDLEREWWWSVSLDVIELDLLAVL